jgi:hypothetical protein
VGRGAGMSRLTLSALLAIVPVVYIVRTRLDFVVLVLRIGAIFVGLFGIFL